jgi:hypothetical protein
MSPAKDLNRMHCLLRLPSTTLLPRLVRQAGVFGALVVMLLGMPHEAVASRMATVVRGQGAGSDTAAALVGHFLRDAMGRDERYEVVDLSRVLGNQDRERALHTFQLAEEMVQKGHDAYDRLDLDVAIDVLQNTLQRYERQAAYVADFKKVAEALMLLGATHILKGEESLGTACLQQAINVYPEVETDPRIFNPAMRAQFQQTATKLGTRPTGTLTLTSNPGYAEVFVDGKFVGVTPLSLENITEGRHYVRMERDAFRPWGKVLEVTAHNETAETATLHATSHYEEFDALAENAGRRVVPSSTVDPTKMRAAMEAADRLGSLVEADTILVAQVRLDGERVQVLANQYDLTSHRLVRAAKHVFTYESMAQTYEHEVAVMLHTSFGTEALATNADAPTGPNAHDGASRPTRKSAARHRGDDALALPHAGQAGTCWHGMSCRAMKYAVASTTFGLGLASLGAAVFEWSEAAHTHGVWAKTNQVDSQQPILRARGRNQALLGDILGGVGGALIIAGTVTFFVWEPGPSLQDVVESHSQDGTVPAVHDAATSEHREAHPQSRLVPPRPPVLAVGAAPLRGGGMLQATWIF